MAKLAKREEKVFSPIAKKLIDSVSSPVPNLDSSLSKEEGGSESNLQLADSYTESGSSEALQQQSEMGERLTRQMRYGATQTEEKDTKEFIKRISTATGLSLTHSNLMRSCRDLLFQVEDNLINEIKIANLKRPINDKHAIARFEAHITEIIRTAIRKAPIPFSNMLYEHDGKDN
jgi:hypothetical protein